MRKYVMICVVLGSVMAIGLGAAYGQGFGGGHVTRKNAAGGVTSGGGRAIKGASGGYVGGHGVATDGQGNAAGGSAQAFKGPNGAMGARAGGFTRSADGSVQHKSGGAVSGAKGTASSSGSMTKDAGGNVSGSRDTTAKSTSGATYDGSTTYDKDTGVTHTSTCTNASGELVPCTQ
jgi:hypothetical protein